MGENISQLKFVFYSSDFDMQFKYYSLQFQRYDALRMKALISQKIPKSSFKFLSFLQKN